MHQLCKLIGSLGLWLLTAQLVLAQAPIPPTPIEPTPIRLGAVQVLSLTQEPPKLEIALNAPLIQGSIVRLAPKATHERAGYAYPLWLSDALWTIKDRPGQRAVLQLETKRTPSTRSHEIVIEFKLPDGTRQTAVQTLLLDVPPQFAGAAMPSESLALENPDTDKPPLTADKPSIANAALPNTASAPNQGFAVKTQNTKTKPPVAAKPTPSRSPNPEPSAPATETASEATALPSTTPSTTPSATAPLAAPITQPPMPPKVRQTSTFIFDELTWLIIAGGTLITLLLVFLLVGIWRRRQAHQARNAPVLTQETQFGRSPQDNGANTVFGLSDNEAIAVQQQWLQKK